MNDRLRRSWPVVAGLALGFGLALQIAPYQMDDAFITYRYAANLADGHGFVFEPGADPVEGFTSPLWCVLLALGALLGGAAALPAVATGLGLASFAGVLAVVRHPIAVALLAALPGACWYAVTGMEAMAFLLLVLVYALAVSSTLDDRWGWIAGALAIWVRPEAGWLPIMLVCQRGPRHLLTRRGLRLAGAVVGGGLLLLAWRWAVFQDVLPNTAWAKEPSLSLGLTYVGQTLWSPAAVAIVALGLLGAALGGPAERGYALGAASWVLAVVLEGGDWMPAGRFLLPAFGLLALAATGLAATGPGRRRWAIPAVVVAVGLSVWGTLDEARKADWSDANIREEARELAAWIRESGAESVAAVDIGLVGFETRATIVDLGGLTDPEIGRAPGGHLDKDFDPEYVVVERAPDLIVIRVGRPLAADKSGRLAISAIAPVERRLVQGSALWRGYRVVHTILPPDPTRNPYYGKVIFARSDFEPRR